MVYYNNNGEIYAYDSEAIYDQNIRYDSDGNDIGWELVTLEEAQAIIAEVNAAAASAAETAQTIPERIYSMEGLAASILDLECKNEKYFYNTGFTHGEKSIRRFPNHPDAIKLQMWADSVWEQVALWVKSIYDGPVDPVAFTTVFIAENLPKID